MTIFVDKFSDNVNHWLENDSAELSLHVEKGGYVIEQRQDSGWRNTWKIFENHTNADLSIQVKIQKVLGASDSYYGILWGGDNKGNFNSLLINFKKQFYIGKYIDKEWADLAPWQSAPIQQESGTVNELAIFIQKDNIEVHINGFQVLKRERRNMLSGNNIGFLVGHSLKIKVLSFEVRTGSSVQIPKVSKFSSPTIKRTHVDSSNLRSVGYDNTSQILEIEFNNGAVYQYYSVPQRIYVELMQAESHGEYFYAFVRDRFQYKQVRDKSTSQTNHYDNDDYDDYGEDYDPSDLKYDLGMDFMSDSEFDDWLEDSGSDRD